MRFGPLLVAVTGAVLIALEFRPQHDGPSLFWLVVGGMAVVLGVTGHVQRNRDRPAK